MSETSTSFPPSDQFRGRGNEPPIVSYSQNAEDVRLWRVFGNKHEGFYVDVGAGDPVRDSVTKLFYDAGWSGLNIEPGPLHAELVEARPRDVNLELAVTTQEGEADFWVSSPDSGFSGFERLPDELLPEDFSFTRTRIRCARLDALIDEHARGRTIDFLKIDVEGAEADVLSSFDPETIRPTVVLVEAISPLENRPNHDRWESLLVDHGYVFAAFDGLNRFYVPVEHRDLIDTLAYPISVLDRYETADVVAERSRAAQQLEHTQQLAQENEALRGGLSAADGQVSTLRDDVSTLRDDLSALRGDLTAVRGDLSTLRGELSTVRAVLSSSEEEVRRLALENRTLAAGGEQAAAELRAIQATVSWRVTRPLRIVRGVQLRGKRPAADTGVEEAVVPAHRFVAPSPGVAEADPIFAVSGVTASEILRRCATPRAARTTSSLAGTSDADFVRAAHVALLGRPPGEDEASRRAAELRAGRSRFEILARLALSPEGRSRRDQHVSGVALRSLVATGRGIELAARTPVLRGVVRRVERFVRDDAPSAP